ncbi:MAG: aryl-sulfate sulfotransferase, partial [Bacteroidia bacterium]
MLPGGVLLRTVKTTNNVFTGGGMSGRVQKVDYNGNLLWDFTYSTATYCAHHDVCALPNGNVLMIVYELKSAADATQAGSQSAITMWPDKVIEVQPTGATTGTIVWEWHLWDHLCQSTNPNVDNYVTNVGDHPELFNINASQTKEVFHANGLDYNPMLDQIALSAHNTDEFYIIDHSTTMAEAASHSGGRGGKGGDFLYRWGNPSNYNQAGNTIFNVIHDSHWIPEDCPNAGNLVALNNKGISNTQSCVDQATTPVAGFNYSYTPNTAYAPSTYTLRQNCTGGTTNMGNSQQLPNGNMLICLALSGVIYEIDPAGTTLWSYTASGPTSQAFRYSACQIANAAP